MTGSIARTARRGGLIAFLAVLLSVLSIGSAKAADILHEDRQYHVYATTITAINETGRYDWMGSDEVYGGFRLSSGDDRRWETQTRLFGNFDTGHVRHFDWDQNCLHPTQLNFQARYPSGIVGHRWTCTQGAPAPIRVEGQLWESDGPHWTHQGWPALSAIVPGDDDNLGFTAKVIGQDGHTGLPAAVGGTTNHLLTFKGGSGHYQVTILVQRVL